MEKDNRTRLLETAVELFSTAGYAAVSIRQIAEKAGVNSAMISYYFGSKQKLYEAALSSQLHLLDNFLTPELAALDPREVLRRYAHTMQEVHAAHPTLIHFICREFSTPDEQSGFLFRKMAPRLYTALSDALRRGVEQKLFRSDLQLDAAVLLLVGMVNFYYLSRRVHSRVLRSEDLLKSEAGYLRQALDVFLRGIERRPAS